MADDCLRRLLDPEVQKKLFGEREVPKELLRRLEKDINDIKVAADNNPNLGTFQSRVQDYIKEKRELNNIQQEVKASNLRKTKERLDFYSQDAFKRDPVEALKSKLTFSKFLANGGRDSLAARIQTLNSDYKNALLGGLKSEGLEKIALSGKIDQEIYVAVEALQLGETPKGVSQEAIKIAGVVKGLNEKFFRDMRNAGVPVRHMPGYVGAQTHNIDKIRKDGFQTWFEKTMPRLDLKRTFGVNAGDNVKMIKSMEAIYKSIIAGRVGEDANIGGSEIEDTLMNTGHTRSLSNKLSESRFLHFSDASKAYAYNADYGRGNMMENIVADINKRSKMIAAVQKFGSNPEASVQADIERLVAKHGRDGNPEAADKIMRSKQDIINMYNEVMNNTSIPSENTVARIGRGIRVINTLSKLGNAGIRAASNFAVAAVELKTTTGKNLMESSVEVIESWLKTIPSEKRFETAKAAGMFLQDMNAEFLSAGMADHMEKGWGTRSMQLMFKLNGLDAMTGGMKTAYARVFMKSVADEVGKDFEKIHPRMQATMLANGIDKTDFRVLEKAVQEMPDGRKMVTSEGILGLDNDTVKAAASAKGMSMEAYRRELQLKYAGAVANGADISSTTAGARERNIINDGTYTGTVKGEVRRLIGQFKSFAIQAHFIAHRVLESAPDQQRLLRGELMSQGKDWMSLSQLMIGTTLIGYMSQALIDTANGKAVKDPKKADSWVDAMVKGGAGGLYTDFLLGEYDKYSFVENLAGPTLGQLGAAAKTLAIGKSALTDGSEKLETRFLKESTRLIRNNIPFQNVPMIKAGFDYLQYDVIQESLSPGYKARSALYQMREERKNRVRPFEGGE